MVAYAAGVFFGDPTGMYPLTARSSKEAIVRAAKMDRLLNAQAQWEAPVAMPTDGNMYSWDEATTSWVAQNG